MEEYEAKIHRTVIGLLIESNFRDVAALLVDGATLIDYYGSFDPQAIEISLPSGAYLQVINDPAIQKVIERAVKIVAAGNVTDQNGYPVGDRLPVKYRMQLNDLEENWRDVIKDLIANAKTPNQGVVTEKAFARRKQQVYQYNEMRFGSQAEVRIAQELERRKVLFFPLPLAIRSDSGDIFEDHREPDFLICNDGVWGILEVSFHQDRYEKDSEKDTWFKKSGILCIQHYTSERAFNNPSDVVSEFLSILSKYKR